MLPSSALTSSTYLHLSSVLLRALCFLKKDIFVVVFPGKYLLKKMENLAIEPQINFLDFSNGLGFTPLNAAAWNGNLEKVKALLSNGASPNSVSKYGKFTALHSSAWNGHLDVVEYLVRHGARVNPLTDKKYTPLNGAVWNGHGDVASFLVEIGADVNIPDAYGFTPLHSAAWKGRLKMAAFLLVHGANVNGKNRKNGYTPLHAAARMGHLNVVQLLLNNGANLRIQDNNGRTALMVALDNGKRNIVQYMKRRVLAMKQPKILNGRIAAHQMLQQ